MNDANTVNPETEEFSQDDMNESIFGSDSSEFFADLDREVNGSMLDPVTGTETEEVTQAPAPIIEASNPDSQETNVNYEKRYKDSSREAQKLKGELDAVKPFMPILERMNEDEDLVEVVKDYLVNGKQTPELKMPEDLNFDLEEAIGNPGSESAKYFNALMDKQVSSKVNNIMGQERQRTEAQKSKDQLESDANEFKQRTGISDDDFEDMMSWANEHKMSYEDLYFMKNRGKVEQNVSNATREDMLKQMQAVREIPTSQANVNSAPVPKADTNRQVLDALKGLDKEADSLFD